MPRDAVAAGGLSVTIVGDPADYARLIGRALEGIDLEAADEVVDRMDDPRIARRFGHLSIKTAPIVLRMLDRGSPSQVLPRRMHDRAHRPRAHRRTSRVRARAPARPRRPDVIRRSGVLG